MLVHVLAWLVLSPPGAAVAGVEGDTWNDCGLRMCDHVTGRAGHRGQKAWLGGCIHTSAQVKAWGVLLCAVRPAP